MDYLLAQLELNLVDESTSIWWTNQRPFADG